MKPFIKYVGGKSWLVDKLVPEILAVKPALYVEPFLGGGAIALALPTALPKVLGDANPRLVDVWVAIQRHSALTLRALRRLETWPESEWRYYTVRDNFNRMIGVPMIGWPERAAHFLWLNARCFNGLWRTNARGLFNVPWGKYEKPRVIDDLELYAPALRLATISHGGFADTLERGAGVRPLAVFADPPYDGTFDGYTAEGFSDDAQRRLAAQLDAIAGTGAAVWATNSDTPLVRRIYDWAQIEAIDERHSVGATGERRGMKPCVLIRGGRARTDA